MVEEWLCVYLSLILKMIVHSKIKSLSLFTLPHVIQNLYEFLFQQNTK